MKRVVRCLMLLVLAACLLAPSAMAGSLNGVWTLEISNYKNTCGGKPTAAKELTLTQSGKSLTVAIEVLGTDGKTYTGTFKGSMERAAPPAKASLYGKFVVAGFTTKETIEIKFLDGKTFSGHARWESKSDDGKTTCIGTQDIKGQKK